MRNIHQVTGYRLNRASTFISTSHISKSTIRYLLTCIFEPVCSRTGITVYVKSETPFKSVRICPGFLFYSFGRDRMFLYFLFSKAKNKFSQCKSKLLFRINQYNSTKNYQLEISLKQIKQFIKSFSAVNYIQMTVFIDVLVS